jgi:diphthamide biosynthesis protein 2
MTLRPNGTSLDEFYEISLTAARIVDGLGDSGNATLRVALQFPDYLLRDGAQVSWALETAILKLLATKNASQAGVTPLLFVLGDTTYGSCCVDEVAAEHLSADVIVHYGRSCLSKTARIPTLYVFGKCQVDAADAFESICKGVEAAESRGEALIVLYDVMYYHAVKEMEARLRDRLGNLIVGELPAAGKLLIQKREDTVAADLDVGGDDDDENDGCCGGDGGCGDASDCAASPTPPPLPPPPPSEDDESAQLIVGGLHLPTDTSLSACSLLYVGSNARQLTNIMMRAANSDGGTVAQFSYDPKTLAFNPDAASVCSKELNRRFYLVQKAKSANVIGIVVATLSVTKFQTVVDKIKKQIADSGRTSYLFVVGKVNVAKLSNFGEIDAFVLVACPENSLLDSREFHVPIITPWELEIALDYREWGLYSVEFHDYLGSGECGLVQDGEVDEVDEDAPFFDLVTGQYVEKRKKEAQELELAALPGQGVVTKYSSDAADFLNSREYQGIAGKADEGEEVKRAVKGAVGIASGYSTQQNANKI